MVRVREGAASAAQRRLAAKVARASKGKLKHTYASVISGFAAELDSAAVDALRADPEIALVEPDPIYHTTGSQSGATWGLDRIDQPALPLDGGMVT